MSPGFLQRTGGAVLLLAASATAAIAQPANPAGWQTWVIESGSALRLPPPPDAETTRAELSQLRGLVAEADGATRARIAWWNAVPPSYRWNQVAQEELIRAGVGVNMATRRLALLHAALADAMVAAWDSKQAHGRARPAMADPALRPLAPVPDSPSYPDEQAVAGAVAAALLADFFPQRAVHFAQLAEEAGRLRQVAGLAYPSDVAAGTELGQRIAAAALERGRRDGSDRPWSGSVPATPGLWNGTGPAVPQAATWMPWLLATPAEFRPPPPPAPGTPERAAEMAAVRAFPRTPTSNGHVLFWEGAAGGLRIFDYWNQHAARLTLEGGMAQDAPGAARTFALVNVALYDAGVACWDAKYAYWTIRPFQLDPAFRTVVTTPNHPSYPAAHACFSMAAATVLAHLFPGEAATLGALARESGESRVWGGLHYPSDVAAAQELARRVAQRAIERAQADATGR